MKAKYETIVVELDKRKTTLFASRDEIIHGQLKLLKGLRARSVEYCVRQ